VWVEKIVLPFMTMDAQDDSEDVEIRNMDHLEAAQFIKTGKRKSYFIDMYVRIEEFLGEYHKKSG
jgi:hypothetical protein